MGSTSLFLILLPVIASSLGCSDLRGQTVYVIPKKVDARTEHVPALLLTGHTSEVYTVTFSPDGRFLASGSNREVIVWNAATGKQVFNYPIKGTNVYGLAFRPDGKQLAVGISRVVKVLDARTGREELSIGGAAHFLFRLAFSPDGRYLAAAGGSMNNTGEARVCEAATGKEVYRLGRPGEAVLNVAYSPDGRCLASASGAVRTTLPGKVVVWDSATGREIRAFCGHAENVYGVAFNPAAIAGVLPSVMWTQPKASSLLRAAHRPCSYRS